MVKWTVDVEYDWGGRTNGTIGITEGLPKIISAFKDKGVTGIFFISTELISQFPRLPFYLREVGHEVGSHGHFHTVYKEKFRQEKDRRLSMKYFQSGAHYRAPKFSYENDDIYSKKEGHTGLLKHMWLKEPMRKIFYLHPFDIVETKEKAPNLFCKLWYSQPKRAYETFINLLDNYSSLYSSSQASQKT